MSNLFETRLRDLLKASPWVDDLLMQLSHREYADIYYHNSIVPSIERRLQQIADLSHEYPYQSDLEEVIDAQVTNVVADLEKVAALLNSVSVRKELFQAHEQWKQVCELEGAGSFLAETHEAIVHDLASQCRALMPK